jgi:drug/metabolite transporter (DMT)-like permease
MKGLLYMALSAVAFSLNSLLVKVGSAYFPALQLVAARSIIQMSFGIISCLFLGIKVLGPRHLWSWLWLRGLFGSVGLALFYFSITILPLADATGTII